MTSILSLAAGSERQVCHRRDVSISRREKRQSVADSNEGQSRHFQRFSADRLRLGKDRDQVSTTTLRMLKSQIT